MLTIAGACIAKAQPAHRETQVSPQQKRTEAETFKEELSAALTKKDIVTLDELTSRFAALLTKPMNPADHESRDARLGIFLAGIQSIDNARDPKFDSADLPQANIAPPYKKGEEIYDSGISPDGIKDPEVRAEYKRRIAANNLKREQHEFQSWLKSAHEDLAAHAIQFRYKYFSSFPEDLAKIEGAVDKHVNDGVLRAELKEKLIGKEVK